MVLPRGSLAVTHGGSGSVLGPLLHGLPLVVVPLGADHFENAPAVERAGAGIVIAPDKLTADTVADAASRCLSNDELRSVAAASRRSCTSCRRRPRWCLASSNWLP
jgi:UDP:flavonoid glycosyltransferase YjiC (YdhE family)